MNPLDMKIKCPKCGGTQWAPSTMQIEPYFLQGGELELNKIYRFSATKSICSRCGQPIVTKTLIKIELPQQS